METKEKDIFQYQIQEEDNGVKKATVKITPQDYEDKFNKELKASAKSLRLKGFRPGKVPLSYAKKLIGKNIMNNILSEKLDETAKEIVENEDKYVIISPTVVSDEKTLNKIFNSLNPSGELELKYQVVDNLNLEELEEKIKENIVDYKTELTEEQKEFLKYISSFKITNGGDPISFEEAQNDEVFLAKLEIHTEDDKVYPFTIVVTKKYLPEVYEQIINLKESGEEITIDFNDKLILAALVANNSYYILPALKEILKGTKVKVISLYKLKDLSEEIGKDYAIRYLGVEEDKVTEEDIKKGLEKAEEIYTKNKETDLKMLSDNLKLSDFAKVLDDLLESIQLSEDLVKNKYQIQSDEDLKFIAKQLKLDYINSEIASKYDFFKFKIEDFVEVAKKKFGGVVPENLITEDFVIELLNRDKQLEQQLGKDLYDEKILKLLDAIGLKEKKVSLEEFFKKFLEAIKD